MFKACLAFLLSLILLSTPAEAAPIGAAIAALSSWWAGASLLIKIGVMLAINVGMGLLEQYRARKAAKGANNQPRGVTLQVQMGDTLPRSYLIGTRATAGLRKYAGVWGSADGTPNAYFVDVRELSCLPSHAGPAGLQSVRIADKYVTVLWAEPHPDGRGYPVQEYRAAGVDYLWVKYLDGTQTLADPYLRAKFAGHASRPWRETMIGRGCQAVIVTLRHNASLYRNGLPEMLFVPTPMRLYDIRKDGAAGGSGSHRWADPSTWETSDNLAVMAYNVARGLYYGERWVHGGRNFSAHRLPASAWMAAMNEADRDMGAGRRQFRGGLEVQVNSTGLDVLEELRVGMAGRFAEVGGSLKLLVGAPAAAVWTLTDATIVVTRDQDFEPFPSLKKAVNTVRATYPEPAQGWRSKEAPEQSSAALLIRDGEELAVDVDIDAVSSSAQVQCITKTMAEEAQRWRTHRFILPPSARPLEPNDVVSWSSTRNGYSDKKFMLSRIRRLKGCLWEVIVQEIDPSDYNPPVVIVPPVTGPTGEVPVPPQIMAGWGAEKASVDDNAGTARRPAIRVSCTPELEDVASVHVQIRVKTTGALVFDNSGSTPYPAPGTGGVYSWLLTGTWCVAGGAYLVRGRLVPGTNRPTLWSEDMEVVVDKILMTDVSVDLANIGQAARNVFNDLAKDLDDLRPLLERITSMLEMFGAVTMDSRRRMEARYDANFASFDEQIVVASNATKALAEQITDIMAAVGGISAQGRVRFSASADQTGALARFSVQLRIGDAEEDEWFDAGFYLQIVRDEHGAVRSEFAILADRFVVIDPNDLTNTAQAVAVEDGVLKLALAHILRLETGKIGKTGGRMEIDIEDGSIEIWSEAAAP